MHWDVSVQGASCVAAARTQARAHALELGRRLGQLDLGPVLVAAVLGPQGLAAHAVVRLPENLGDALPLLRLVGRQVHDDAHPRVERLRELGRSQKPRALVPVEW